MNSTIIEDAVAELSKLNSNNVKYVAITIQTTNNRLIWYISKDANLVDVIGGFEYVKVAKIKESQVHEIGA